VKYAMRIRAERVRLRLRRRWYAMRRARAVILTLVVGLCLAGWCYLAYLTMKTMSR